MQPRMLLAIFLTGLVLMGMNVIQMHYYPPIMDDSIVLDDTILNTPQTSINNSNIQPQNFSSVNDYPSGDFLYENDVYKVVFNKRGASIKSLELKKHLEQSKPVQLLSNNPDANFNFFDIMIDDKIINDNFSVKQEGQNIIFTNEYDSNGDVFAIIKEYSFSDGYLFFLDVKVTSANLGHKLVVGPTFETTNRILDAYNNYRIVRTLVNSRNADYYPDGNGLNVGLNNQFVALYSKYFTTIVSGDDFIKKSFDIKSFNFDKNIINTTIASDNNYKYTIYAGPKDINELSKYDSKSNNSVGLEKMSFSNLIDHGYLWFFEIGLKFLLKMFYDVFGNWGIAIIVLTIFIKIILFPLTHKSYESTAAMQKLAPKMKELQEKYKDNPQELNLKMAEMYQKEGVNPVGGCLPMLLQMPIFFALYSLLNYYFDIRDASFIPGWIDDLSSPESVYYFGDIFTIPFIGISDIRVLPFLMVISQIIVTKISSSQAMEANPSMKMMMYWMPVMFLFILYNMPSGLILYWTMSNIITAVQQWYINNHLQPKNTENK